MRICLNGVNTTWNYETNRDLITRIAHGSVSTLGYTNDALGRRTSMSRSGSVFATPDTIAYGYNDRSEVISAVSNVDAAYHYSYSFDPIGNRTAASLQGKTWSYTANALNQYTGLTVGNATETPTYDADGNMTLRNGWTQNWNGENRLVSMTRGDTRLEFAYDYMGRWVEKKVYYGESLTKHIRFVYDGYKLIEELDALDSETALVYYNYRYYDPQLGRWLSRDPIQELGGWNLYAMLKNNPASGIDKLGLHKCPPEDLKDLADRLKELIEDLKELADQLEGLGIDSGNLGQAADGASNIGNWLSNVATYSDPNASLHDRTQAAVDLGVDAAQAGHRNDSAVNIQGFGNAVDNSTTTIGNARSDQEQSIKYWTEEAQPYRSDERNNKSRRKR